MGFNYFSIRINFNMKCINLKINISTNSLHVKDITKSQNHNIKNNETLIRYM